MDHVAFRSRTSGTPTPHPLPCIGLEHEEVALTGYSVVHDTAVTGFIPIEACKGLNFLKTDNAKTLYVVPYKQYQFTVEVTLTEREVTAYCEDGRPVFRFSLKLDATLEYGDRKTPFGLTDADNEAMTALLKQMVERDVRDAIFQAQTTFKTDYLQLDDAFRVAFPVEYESMDWDEAFSPVGVIAAEAEVNLKHDYVVDYAVDV